MTRLIAALVVVSAVAGCDNRYNAVTDGEYLCTATTVSTTCGPALPDSESVVYATGSANLTTGPLGLPSPLDPSRTMGGFVQFGPQDDGFTYGSSGYQGCGDFTAGYETEQLAILVDFSETSFDFRLIQRYAGLSACDFADVVVDECRAERNVSCALIE